MMRAVLVRRGPFFRLSDGTLVRPAQDCSQTYGGAIQLFQVDHLSPADYVETFLRRVDPPAGPWAWGLHTLCPIDEASCLIDAKRWVSATAGPLSLLAKAQYFGCVADVPDQSTRTASSLDDDAGRGGGSRSGHLQTDGGSNGDTQSTIVQEPRPKPADLNRRCRRISIAA